jgi:hypothetical protein
MLRILLDLYHLPGFLELSAICMLFVRPHSKYVFALNRNSMPNNREPCVFADKGCVFPLHIVRSSSNIYSKTPFKIHSNP